MKKYLLLFVCCLINFYGFSGELKDKFKAFTSMEGVSAIDCTSELKKEMGATYGEMAMPTPDPSMMKFPFSFAEFLKSLPQESRLNKGKLAEGEPEVFFSQLSPQTEAEVIMILRGDNGVSAVSFMILPAKQGVDFKNEAIKMLSK